MTPLYIFDLDGTLALTEHRQHLLDNKEDPDRWRKFFAACVADQPNWPVIGTANALLKSGADVWIWSGRSGEVMNETLSWLHRFFDADTDEMQLCMRREGDFTPDEQLKAGWFDALNDFDRRRLVAIFDDRQKVVDMWRSKGIACFQVAPGTF